MKQYILYGNGGHSRVLKDVIHLLGGEVVHVFDSENAYNAEVFPNAELIIAIGNSEIREKISQEVSHQFAKLIHPKAILASDVKMGEGSVILANAVIQVGSEIGKHCIINSSTVIDHDVIIGDFVSIYPNSYIGGGAQITNYRTIEPNSVVERLSIV